MPIVAIGTDLTPIERIEKLIEQHGEGFKEKVFTPAERAFCDARKEPATHYAGRFAAKEATMKVLGTGWGKGVSWQDVQVQPSAKAGPSLLLKAGAKARAGELGIETLHLSISHDAGLALAFVVGESHSR